MNLRSSGVMVLSAVVLLAGALSPAGTDPLHDSLQKLRAKINAAKQAKTQAKNPNPKSTPAVRPRLRRTASLPVHIPRVGPGQGTPSPAVRPSANGVFRWGPALSTSRRAGAKSAFGDIVVDGEHHGKPLEIFIDQDQARMGHAEKLDVDPSRAYIVHARIPGGRWKTRRVTPVRGKTISLHVSVN